MPWLTQASDNFNRADENPLGNGVWSTGSGESAMSVATNQCAPSASGSDCSSRYSGRAWAADQFSRAKLTAGSSGEQGPALSVRYASGARTYYRCCIDNPGGGATNIVIRRFVAGASTNIASATQAWTNGDTWELRVSGP